MNNSIESPRHTTGTMQTPMTHSMQVDSLRTSPKGTMRLTTPQGKALPMSQQKFTKKTKRVNNMKDMVFIYADMGQSKQLR